MDTNSERKSPIREEPLRLPGQGVDERLRDLAFNEGLDYIVPGALAWSMVIGSFAQLRDGRAAVSWAFLGIAVVVTIWGALGFRRVFKQIRNFKLGRQGERLVGQMLQTLDLPEAVLLPEIRRRSFPAA
jgi:hypothetical protein